jgi:hypothetical protein
MIELKVGQRWMYSDSQYTWIVECISTSYPALGVIIQIIRDDWIKKNQGPNYAYAVGIKTSMERCNTTYDHYFTYLEGQDSP